MATITTSEFPPNWLAQGYTMAYKVVYLVKAYSIPPTFVVNNDQNGIPLIPNGDERTWEPKGTKNMQVLALEDKKQITMVVSSSATRDGWDLTFSENHWSPLETTKKFVTNILLPYLQS